MKRFYKTCGIIAGVCIVFGISFCIVGGILGASLIAMAKENKLSIYFNETGLHSGTEAEDDLLSAARFEKDDVKRLEVSNDMGQVNIYTHADNDTIFVENYGDKYTFKCKMEGSTLRISQDGALSILSFGGSKSGINIYIPEDMAFEKVKIDVDAGNVYVENIVATELLEFDIDAGDITCNAYETKNLKVDVDAGGVNFFDGNFTGNAEIDCDAGSVQLNLRGVENSVNYDLQSDIGVIEINGTKYNGLSVEQQINNKADRNLKVDVDAGNIAIYTD